MLVRASIPVSNGNDSLINDCACRLLVSACWYIQSAELKYAVSDDARGTSPLICFTFERGFMNES